MDLKNLRRWNLISYAIGIGLSILILRTDLIVSGLIQFYWGPYPKAGKLHPLYLFIFLSFLISSIFLLGRAVYQRNQNATKSNQLKYFLCAFAILFLASIDFLPNYGLKIYPIGYIPTFLFTAVIAYAIVKHRLLDINIVLHKTLGYSILAAAITVLYMIIVLCIERMFNDIFGYQSFIISLFLAILIALCFIPLKNRVQTFVDRLFFKGTQAEIAHQNELLKQELVRTEQLKIAATLASGLAHEIRNPLTVLKTHNEYLIKKINEPGFLENHVRISSGELARIEKLIQDLLDFSKPHPPQFEDIDIHDLIEASLDFIHNKLEKSRIHLCRDFGGKQTSLKIDPHQMKQVFLNLFLNACDAMPDGGVLTVKTQCDSHKNFLQILISDTGCGIEKNDLPHIFDPFYTNKATGTGLGLSITDGIIKEHKGMIKVRCEINNGTTFRSSPNFPVNWII